MVLNLLQNANPARLAPPRRTPAFSDEEPSTPIFPACCATNCVFRTLPVHRKARMNSIVHILWGEKKFECIYTLECSPASPLSCIQEQYLDIHMGQRESERTVIEYINVPSLTKITKTGDDIRLPVEAFVDPPSNLETSKITSMRRKCNKAWSRTTRSCGYLEQNVLRPSGADIYEM